MATIVIFAQQKGGAGKSTLVANIAGALAAAGARVAVLDLDPQRSITAWGALREAAGGRAPVGVRASDDWRAGTDIRRAAAAADWVLVDCPGAADVLLRAAMREATLVVTPCQPSPVDALATGPVLEMAAKEGRPARVAINRAPPRGGRAEAVAAGLTADGATLFETRVGNRVLFATSFGAGLTAAEAEPRSKAAAEIGALVGELTSLCAAL